MSGTCDDAETAAAVAAALAEEMGGSRELSSLLSNGGKVRTPVLSNEILMVFTGGRQRRRTRGCSDVRISNDLDKSEKQKGTRKHQGSSGLTSDRGLLSPLEGPSSHTTKPGEPEERPDSKDQLVSSVERTLPTGLLESVDFLGVDAASQATIATLLDEDFRASRESTQLLRGGEVKEIYEHLAFSFASVGSRRRYTRSAAQRLSSTDHARKELSSNQLPSPSADVASATLEGLKTRHADKLPRVSEVKTTSPGITFSKAETGNDESHRTTRTYRRRAEADTGANAPRVAVKQNSTGETSENEVFVPRPESGDGGFTGFRTPFNGSFLPSTATNRRGRQGGVKRAVPKREGAQDTLEERNYALGEVLSRLPKALNENSREAEGERMEQGRGAKIHMTADAAAPRKRGPQATDDRQMQPGEVLRQRKQHVTATACSRSRHEQEEVKTRRSLLGEDSSSNETEGIMQSIATKELESGRQQTQSRQVVQDADGTAPLSQKVKEEGQLAESRGRNEPDSDGERTRDCEVVEYSCGVAVPKQERHIENRVESGTARAAILSTGMAQEVQHTDWTRERQKGSERSSASQERAGDEAVSGQLKFLDTETGPDGMGAVCSKRLRPSQSGPRRGKQRAEREAPHSGSRSGRASPGEGELGDSLPSSKRKHDEIASSLGRGAKSPKPGRRHVTKDTVVEDASTTSEEGGREARVCISRNGGRKSRSLREISSREPSGEDLARDFLHQSMAGSRQGLTAPPADNGIQVYAKIGRESAGSCLLPDPEGEDLDEIRGKETGEERQREGQKKWRREATEEGGGNLEAASASGGRRAARETSSVEDSDSERKTAAEVEKSPHRLSGGEQKRMEETHYTRTSEAPPPPTSAESPRKLVIRRRPVKPKAPVNFTLCGICGGFGDVLCCDFCPRVFHPICLFKYHPLRVFVPVELRSSAAQTLSASSSSPTSHASCHRTIYGPDWGTLPPPPPPLPGYRSHSESSSSENDKDSVGDKRYRLMNTAGGAGSSWMCPDCYGVPYPACRPVEHPAWRAKPLEWKKIAEEDNALYFSFPSLDFVKPYFGDEEAWQSFKERKGPKLLRKSSENIKAAGTKRATENISVYLPLTDFPLIPARELMHAMSKKAALHAVAFLKNLLLSVANSRNDVDQINFLEFGAEVAYLLTNLLGYVGSSRHLVDPIVDAASCILLLWCKRREKLGQDEISSDEGIIFSTLEACWAQLVLHRYSTKSALAASSSSSSAAAGTSLAPSRPTLKCSLGEQRLCYLEWKSQIEQSISASRLDFLYFDFRGGQLLYYDLSTCPNCNRSGGVVGRFAICSFCNFLLPPEWACVDFGRLFEQLVWGSLLQRAGIDPSGGKQGTQGSSTSVEQILSEMKNSLRPWRNRLDLGTEDWKNQVYMVAHALFVVSGWGKYRLDLRERFWLPDTRFLRFALHEAMLIGDVELTGEILHSLHLFVFVPDNRRSAGCRSSASGGGPSEPSFRMLTEEEEDELLAEQFAIDLSIQHGIIFLLYKQSRHHRGRWTTKQDSFYKTFHSSFCAAMGLIRPHRSSSEKKASNLSSPLTVDKTHGEWQRLFCSSWPHASVSLASPSAVDAMETAKAAMNGPAVSKARHAAGNAAPIVPLSCGAYHFLAPRRQNEFAVKVATVKVSVKRPLRRMTSAVWRRVCRSAAQASRQHKKSTRLFGEKTLLGPDIFGKSEDIPVGVYCFQGLCFVSLEDLSALLLCEASFLENRVLSFIRPALVIPAVEAQQAGPNRHVPPEFHRFFTAFANRHGLNGGIEEEETESDGFLTPSSSFSPSKSSASSPGFQSSSPRASGGENRTGTPEGGSLSARAVRGSGHENERSGAKGSTKRLFSLLDLKELLTLQSVMGIAEALVLPVEENIGAMLRAVERQVFRPVDTSQ